MGDATSARPRGRRDRGPREPRSEAALAEAFLKDARGRLAEKSFDAALEAAAEAARVAPRESEVLRRSAWSHAILAARGILEPCDPDDPAAGEAWDLLGKARDAHDAGRFDDASVLARLGEASRQAHALAAARLRELLASVRDGIREAANVGVPVALAEDAWTRAADSLDRGDLADARGELAVASRMAFEARERRARDVEAVLAATVEHLARSRDAFGDSGDATAVLEEARAAVRSGDLVRAGELAKRAERLALEGNQARIEKAMEIRQAQLAQASAIISGCEPLVMEAESFDLGVAEARVLLRQARDVLAKGDILQGLTLARNAEEVAHRLVPLIQEERRRRGILLPTAGVCGVCGSGRLHFFEDGWGGCLACGASFRWRGPAGILEKVRGLLGT